MYKLSAIELLEDTHQFPCPYMFKVIGKSERGFVARTVAVTRDELELEVDPPFSFRETAGGRHVAVTLELEMRDAQQVISVYRRLRQLEGLVLLL